jgi:hypothetical protein
LSAGAAARGESVGRTARVVAAGRGRDVEEVVGRGRCRRRRGALTADLKMWRRIMQLAGNEISRNAQKHEKGRSLFASL